jgi:signal transduction histidine kinase/phage shock protein PspC (stress-responsive transcriptional regulator)
VDRTSRSPRTPAAPVGRVVPVAVASPHWRFARSRSDRVLSGVAGGLGERLGIDPALVRIAVVVLASAAGTGVILYLLGWMASHDPPADAPARTPPRPSVQQALAFGLVLLGLLLLLRELGLWFGDALTWPLALAAAGSGLIWSRSSAEERSRWGLLARLPVGGAESVFAGPLTLARVLAGGALLAAGIGVFLAANEAISVAALGQISAAMAVTVVGAGLLVGPWLWRLSGQLREERRERIRSEERAEMAAHLHDSVLQTLALIQRADAPREVVSLARAQERELRAWLYGGEPEPDRLRTAVATTAARVEERHHVPVEVVAVGDAPLDERLRALAHAAGEAMGNAARHSGARVVSVYLEVEPDTVSCYVTDQGCGFDPQAVPPDRLGIAESIRGRMERHGGRAELLSEAGEGTEVALHMPRRSA